MSAEDDRDEGIPFLLCGERYLRDRHGLLLRLIIVAQPVCGVKNIRQLFIPDGVLDMVDPERIALSIQHHGDEIDPPLFREV